MFVFHTRVVDAMFPQPPCPRLAVTAAEERPQLLINFPTLTVSLVSTPVV